MKEKELRVSIQFLVHEHHVSSPDVFLACDIIYPYSYTHILVPNSCLFPRESPNFGLLFADAIHSEGKGF